MIGLIRLMFLCVKVLVFCAVSLVIFAGASYVGFHVVDWMVSTKNIVFYILTLPAFFVVAMFAYAIVCALGYWFFERID